MALLVTGLKHGLPTQFFCADVFVPIPVEMPNTTRAVTRARVRVDAGACTLSADGGAAERARPLAPGAPAGGRAVSSGPALRQMCAGPAAPCVGRCTPLATRTPALTVCEAVATVCTREWLLAHTKPCEPAGAQRVAGAASARPGARGGAARSTSTVAAFCGGGSLRCRGSGQCTVDGLTGG